jgi:hypothetical protein
MIDAMQVSAGERGVIRLFAVRGGVEMSTAAQIAEALGVDNVDSGQVEVFPVDDLAEVGLADYLSEGCNVPVAEIAPNRDQLNDVTGTVMLVRSRAFHGKATPLHPTRDLILIGTWTEEAPDWSGEAIQSSSALPGSRGVPPRQARLEARRVGGRIFAVVMVCIVVIVLLAWPR